LQVGTAPRPEELASYPRSLGVLQRILLTTDGTVTHVLEAFTCEPIHVVRLSHERVTYDGDDPSLGIAPHETVLRRRVLLQSEHSRRIYIYAESIMVCDSLGSSMQDALAATDTPVGKLLSDSRAETYREIIDWGEKPAGFCASRFGLEPTAMMLFRTYRIVTGGRTAMVITEQFPYSYDTAARGSSAGQDTVG